MINLLIASTSTVHGSGYLEYLIDEVKHFFKGSENIVFVPFARPGGISWDKYTEVAKEGFKKAGLNLTGIHEGESMDEKLDQADGIFVGGGNTFVLLNTLYEKNLIGKIQDKLRSGTPYMGTSAGSNILGKSIRTTNDMPIVYPPTFDAIQAVPFTINPHYIDPDPSSKHMGETRETRIKEYLEFNEGYVVGLREGSYLHVQGNSIELKGALSTRVFHKSEIKEYEPGESLQFLLQ